VAIKRLRLGDDGEFEERKLEKSELPPPPPKPVKRTRKASARASTPRDKTSSSTAASSHRVKVTKRATKVYAEGKTALNVDVIRYECPKCEASRVGTDETQGMTCSLCGVGMRRTS
jgi:hypothetical protein